jgi:hypothetical protein
MFSGSSADEAELRLPKNSVQGCYRIGPQFQSLLNTDQQLGYSLQDPDPAELWNTAGKLDATNATLTQRLLKSLSTNLVVILLIRWSVANFVQDLDTKIYSFAS